MSKNEAPLFNIRQVIQLTGVSEFTLRGWESRYGAFRPQRSDTGRRLYNKNDILKIRLLIELLEGGQKISQIANLSCKNLEAIKIANCTAIVSSNDLNVKYKKNVNNIIQHALKYQWNQAQDLLLKSKKNMPEKEFVIHFLLYLISEINFQADQGHFSIAQEHILSSFIKENLYAIISSKKRNNNNQVRLLLASPEGDFHEIGLLIASALSVINGVQQLYLGPNVPESELCETALRFGASHVLLSSTVSIKTGARNDFLKYLHFLDTHLNSKVGIFVGGRNTQGHLIKINREFKNFNSLAEFDNYISTL